MQLEQHVHIDNLDIALNLIAKIGTLYNGLQRSDQKELLRQVVERVIVDDDGQVTLELRSPFAYLNALVEGIKRANTSAEKIAKRECKAIKNGERVTLTVSPEQCSSHAQSVSTSCTQTEPNGQSVLSQFLSLIAYPKREQRLSCLA